MCAHTHTQWHWEVYLVKAPNVSTVTWIFCEQTGRALCILCEVGSEKIHKLINKHKHKKWTSASHWCNKKAILYLCGFGLWCERFHALINTSYKGRWLTEVSLLPLRAQAAGWHSDPKVPSLSVFSTLCEAMIDFPGTQLKLIRWHTVLTCCGELYNP